MEDYSQIAIELAKSRPNQTYCKFITANDVGLTGGHQSGFYIHKEAAREMFGQEVQRGENVVRDVRVKWQADFETESTFKYYGEGTRNEYRLTKFGRGFPFLDHDMVGNLLILSKAAEDYYQAYVLQTDEEIEDFLEFFGISPLEANGIIGEVSVPEKDLASLISRELVAFGAKFPETQKLALAARKIYNQLSGSNDRNILTDPDSVIGNWIDTEYSLFQGLEREIYTGYLNSPFGSVDNLVEAANTILNRRKSRAGKSLEHHLAAIFDVHELPYSAQQTTEGNKKPDFIIPGIEFYRDSGYKQEKLIFLGAKTTCKDRWRQVLNEAERIPNKHLFTLQPGVSRNQLQEMKEENLTLVVPKKNLPQFTLEFGNVISLKSFIDFSKATIS